MQPRRRKDLENGTSHEVTDPSPPMNHNSDVLAVHSKIIISPGDKETGPTSVSPVICKPISAHSYPNFHCTYLKINSNSFNQHFKSYSSYYSDRSLNTSFTQTNCVP